MSQTEFRGLVERDYQALTRADPAKLRANLRILQDYLTTDELQARLASGTQYLGRIDPSFKRSFLAFTQRVFGEQASKRAVQQKLWIMANVREPDFLVIKEFAREMGEDEFYRALEKSFRPQRSK